MSQIAIIGGTGLSDLAGLTSIVTESPDSRYGKPSAVVEAGVLSGKKIRFLARHGKLHNVPPHKINYRANIDVLHQLGVDTIIAVNAVGALHKTMHPKQIVIPHQIIDYSYGREHTFSDGGEGVELQHVDFTDPYNGDVRFALINAAEKCGFKFKSSGLYACTQGPRLETAAEVLRLQKDGCDVVGMTGMPEAALARELGMAYASVCLVVNLAAGLTPLPITMSDIQKAISQGMRDVITLLRTTIVQL